MLLTAIWIAAKLLGSPEVQEWQIWDDPGPWQPSVGGGRPPGHEALLVKGRGVGAPHVGRDGLATIGTRVEELRPDQGEEE